MNAKEIGKLAEDFACEFLKNRNCEIIERNWSCRKGETDIICIDGKEYVFAEVRCRKKTSSVKPADTLSPSKQKRIVRAAQQYISDNNLNVYARFDFVGVVYSDASGEPVFEIETYLKRIEIV